MPHAASTLVGRAWPCLARVTDPAVPLYWLEVRWQAGWTWRALGAEERTRGPGVPREAGWRDLPTSIPRRPAAVRLDEVLSVELVDDGAPEPFLFAPPTGAYLRGADLPREVEHRGGELLPLAAEGDPLQALGEGDLVRVGDVSWRVHGVSSPTNTLRARIDLARLGVRVAVDASPWRATFLQGDAALEVTGEHLRTLLVYVNARAQDPSGGWLRPTEAWAEWRALGGNDTSPPERVAWDRARLRSQLHALGVGHVEQLFEVARDAGGARVRLAVGG